MTSAAYVSAVPSVITSQNAGSEVILARTVQGVPAGYGQDIYGESIVDIFPDKDAAIAYLKAKWGRDVKFDYLGVPGSGRVLIFASVTRRTAVGPAFDEYQIFNY